ncbi:hypothetical protein SAMN04488030_2965 [Aliiroseovarius halocynthiae]|nr:hypothetical protein SAMN04488030_2965 [Aliiroseovarius halocynthiae]
MAQDNNFKYPCLKFVYSRDNPGKSLILLEASAGIEPVYTDLQLYGNFEKINQSQRLAL